MPLEKFKLLQELHDNQKKIIARLQERVQELEQELKELTHSFTRDKADLE